MKENKIELTDDIAVVNAKLKTDEYKDLDNAGIAHLLQDMGYDIDFAVYMVEGRQVVRR